MPKSNNLHKEGNIILLFLQTQSRKAMCFGNHIEKKNLIELCENRIMSFQEGLTLDRGK